jgi:hypothetical protein
MNIAKQFSVDVSNITFYENPVNCYRLRTWDVQANSEISIGDPQEWDLHLKTSNEQRIIIDSHISAPSCKYKLAMLPFHKLVSLS